ncbi:anthocyanidin 3-O-glucosyltransferase 2-like [Lotus japonicus]|uniref:anthocyanidin 3-O-glucosyltransferase 2-like n=1 Tax=Lotus japonicus TaxID=34305 RepID=UPI00258D5F87|nr:anthocyanidin 3-O-glucosyltransferase 2-like [Lotus japonicus]
MKKAAAAARLVFIPSPGAGHLVSALEFAKLLLNRDDRLWITLFILQFPYSTASESDTSSLSSFSERVQVINLPPPQLPPTNSDTKPGMGNLMITLLENQKPRVKEAVISNLHSAPPLAAFVLDMFCTTMIDVADHFNVPSIVFFTSGVAFLSSMLHLYTLRERHDLEANDLKDPDTEVAIPGFLNPVPSKSLPSKVLNKEWEQWFLNYGRGLKRANGFIVNSFEELEPHAVRSFSDPDNGLVQGIIPIYPVGPILNPKDNGETHEILTWLDEQPPSSVVFLCFGSRGSFDEAQVTEIAHAIVNSGARFVWSLRKPPLKGSMAGPSDYSVHDLASVLPEGFLDRTTEIGRVIGWAPQARVLAHPATGGFVSHCGWNSTLESIYFGVPIATWPLYAEQQTNAFLLVRELKIAVEISLDYRVEVYVGPNYLLTADKIEGGIRSVLDKDGEVRKRVKEMSERSRKTLLEGGCSYSYLDHLIDYFMDQV